MATKAAKREIKLGMEVRDIVTGVTGTVVCRDEWLNGCVRYGVQPRVKKDGAVPQVEWIDGQQLVVTKPTTEATKLVSSPTGGPRPNPRSAPAPQRR